MSLIEDDMTVNFTNATQSIRQVVTDPTLKLGPKHDPDYIIIPITIIYIFIFISGLFGNICTCIVIIRNKSMHTATNYYLFSLAVSDLLLLVSGMPQEIWSIWSKWPYAFGEGFCVLRGLAAETSTNASVMTITFFTIERYFAICHPFLSHTMSKLSRAVKHILVVWVISFGFALPQALQFGLQEHMGAVFCMQTKVIIAHSFEISSFLFFFAPMALITALYVLIALRLSKSRIKRNRSVGRQQAAVEMRRTMGSVHKKQGQSTRRVVKMLGVSVQRTLAAGGCGFGARAQGTRPRLYSPMVVRRSTAVSSSDNSGHSVRDETTCFTNEPLTRQRFHNGNGLINTFSTGSARSSSVHRNISLAFNYDYSSSAFPKTNVTCFDEPRLYLNYPSTSKQISQEISTYKENTLKKQNRRTDDTNHWRFLNCAVAMRRNENNSPGLSSLNANGSCSKTEKESVHGTISNSSLIEADRKDLEDELTASWKK